MRPKACWYRAVLRLGVALTLAILLCLMSPSLTSAQDLNPVDYFQLSYDPVSFDKNEIHGSDVFHVIIAGRLTCTKDLPVPVSETSVTSQVVAEHTASGTKVTLNSSYTITIKPFPTKKDEIAEINQAVPLQFPAQAEPGDYNVIGKIVQARTKVAFAWLNITGYLPQEQPMGLVKYTAPESKAAPPPSTTPPSTTPPSTTPPAPPSPAPPPSPQSAPIPAPASPPPEPFMPWWFELIVIIAVATTVFNIIWFLRHRTR